jgi:acyl-CoA synthetase (AMP-forming)/AMP-acid ligase II
MVFRILQPVSAGPLPVGEEESARVVSVGRLSLGAEVKIVHLEARPALPPGAPGELWVRPPLQLTWVGLILQETTRTVIHDPMSMKLTSINLNKIYN